MNLLATNNQPLTMSSREIAKVVNSRHSDVCTSIQRLMAKDVISEYTAVPYTHEQNKQTYYEYFVCQRDSYIIVAQLSPEFTAALVDRWQELEKNQAPQIPQTYAEALQLAADQAKQLELAAPKVAFVDNLVDRSALMNASQVAQKHKKSAVWLNKILDELKVYNKAVKRGRVFQQWFIDKGLGEMKQTDLGYSQAMFTNAGEVWINEKLYSEGLV